MRAQAWVGGWAPVGRRCGMMTVVSLCPVDTTVTVYQRCWVPPR